MQAYADGYLGGSRWVLAFGLSRPTSVPITVAAARPTVSALSFCAAVSCVRAPLLTCCLAPAEFPDHPLRGHKHDAWEGGTRAAAFISGGLVPSGLRGSINNVSIISIVDW